MLHMGFLVRLYFYGTERIYEPGTQVLAGMMRPDRTPLPRWKNAVLGSYCRGKALTATLNFGCSPMRNKGRSGKLLLLFPHSQSPHPLIFKVLEL